MLERCFKVKAQGSTPRREILAGGSTFLAAMYIIIVNPTILSSAGMSFSAALTATVLMSFIGSLAMGLYARNPILVAPGMGLNALFAYTMVLGAGIPIEVALGCVFWSGVLFLLLAIFNVRHYVVKAIPATLRCAIACGIGLFITTIGLVNAKFVVPNPATVMGISHMTAPVAVFLIGLAITGMLTVRKTQGALIIGVLITTLLAWPVGRWFGDGSAYTFGVSSTLVNFQGFISMPDLSGIGQVDFLGALKLSYVPFIFVILFTTFFDALSTFMGVCQAGNLFDEKGEPRNMQRAMVVDSISALVSAPLGTSPTNAFVESAAGISQGARTGLAAVVCALLFLPFLFLSPLLQLVPAIATAPALIMVGVFMVSSIGKIDWADLEEAVPAFIAMIFIPLTYSITHGVVFGMLAFVVVKVAKGKFKEVQPAMWILSILALLLLLTEH